jgi:XTP/dITP diphosphohydrolase
MPDAGAPSNGSISTDVIQVYVCSSNRGKLRDFFTAAGASDDGRILIEPLPGIEHISPPEESGASFEENAVAKALYYSSFTPASRLRAFVLADDSGLEVDALHGAPGVHSARYAGVGATDAENNRLLLHNLMGVAQRDARFVCVLALAREGQTLMTANGTVEGRILTAPEGSGGFGYDPLFFYAPLQRSFGELTPEEKLAVSHRGLALRKLFKMLSHMLAV